jgi:chromosome segregation ATPase
MASMIQQDLPAQTPAEELEDLYDEEPRRRPWGAILSVVLALAVIFVGYQWQQVAAREQTLRSQVHALRADAETLRLRAEEAQRDVEGLQKRLAAAGAEKTALTERVAILERQAQERAAAARVADQRAAARERTRATPVVQKRTR